MDFAADRRRRACASKLEAFFDERILPAEHIFEEQIAAGETPGTTPPIMEELKAAGREAEGLWNLFLPRDRARRRADQPPVRAALRDHGPQPVPRSRGVQLLGARHRQHGAARAVRHRGAEATGGSTPLLEGETRSAFSMTEPAVASSDATNIATRSRRDGDEYVIDGRKWFTSGAMSPRCELLIVMGVSDPEAATHRRQSMILVAARHPGRRDPALDARARLPRRSPRRPRRDHLRRRPRPARRTCSATRARASRSPRRASARAGSTTRCARSASPSARCRMMVGGVQRARLRRADRRPGRDPPVDRRRADRDRAGPPAGAEDRLADGHGRQPGRARSRSRRSRSSRAELASWVVDHAVQAFGARRRHPGLHPRRADRPRADPADRRRARRGPPRRRSRDAEIAAAERASLGRRREPRPAAPRCRPPAQAAATAGRRSAAPRRSPAGPAGRAQAILAAVGRRGRSQHAVDVGML